MKTYASQLLKEKYGLTFRNILIKFRLHTSMLWKQSARAVLRSPEVPGGMLFVQTFR